MKPSAFGTGDAPEVLTAEGCYIRELSNSAEDEAMSIAQARVEPGVTTQRHRLRGIDERFVILQGQGWVEVGEALRAEVGPGDVVRIPRETPQRIRNEGSNDLVFLCICTPRFDAQCYETMAEEP